jgi:hypothetical protein
MLSERDIEDRLKDFPGETDFDNKAQTEAIAIPMS